jgi:putative thiamine transport system ATP-binding protein
MSGLTIDNLVLAVGGQPLITDLSLHVAPGQIVTVMGASGSGKSSLLSYVCGTLPPAFMARGRVSLHDRVLDGLPPERRRIGILFQDDLLFPHLTVGENLAFAMPRNLRPRQSHIAAALQDAELAGLAHRDPATLSGGQRQRVALMRALLAAPEALLLDEPFSRLDRDLRAQIRRFVFDHATRRGLPVLLVTHDADDAAAAGGPVIALGA